MKLIIYDKSNSETPNRRVGVRSISVTRKPGTFSFSQTAQRDLEIKDGYGVLLAQDDESKNDWYICFADSDSSFTIRKRRNGGYAKDFAPTLYFSNKFIANRLLDTIKAAKAATLLISTKPTIINSKEWYKIVISKPLRIK
ncbi:hypothetical protein [Bacteroides sp.]|uniref:hypothetical protein n=1 Tax=Bacteroides sp. TaxID=29523 RepID=UPI002A82428D|nr:hypothetical protein [Bacteroides sp.]